MEAREAGPPGTDRAADRTGDRTDDRTDALDCRGLTPALAALRIKQAVAIAPAGDGAEPLRVVLGAGCRHEQVSAALGAVARRVRYVTPGAAPPRDDPPPWWQRHDLRYTDGRLHLGGTDVAVLAAQTGTPAYVLRAGRVRENIHRLTGALGAVGVEHRVLYAMKANRSPALLAYLRTRNLCGLDVCSPAELALALGCGFPASAVSFTGTSLSRRDIAVLARHRDLRINLDSVAALDALGRACPGREVGLRVNPGVGVGYQGDERLSYSGGATTKFGVYREQLPEALAAAERWGLRVVRLHVHAGCGYLDGELDRFGEVLDALDAFTAPFPELREVNIGGGLGVPHTAADRPLDLARWAAAVARRFAGRGLVVAVEPGDYLVKDAGLLLTTVTSVERRRDVRFAGLDAGFNLAMEPAFYGLPCEPVAVAPRWDEHDETYTVVGNVNEALDRWAVDHRMTRLAEGDRVALINSGGYAASMRSDHCLRGDVAEVLLIDEHDQTAPDDQAPGAPPRPM